MPKQSRPSETLKQLKLIYSAMLAGQVLFFLVTQFIGSQEVSATSTSLDFFQTLVPALSIGGVGVSMLLYNRMRSSEALKNASDSERWERYRNANIIRWALIEAPNLLAIVAIFLTGAAFFKIYFLLGLAVFAFYRPSQVGFEKDFGG